MDDNKFKKLKKMPACTRRPWEYLIPSNKKYEVISQVERECVELYGHSFNECNKRKLCFTKDCLGRELEWKSPTAKPYLDQFAKDQGIQENALYYVSGCSGCPIKATCNSPCAQINDWMNRGNEPKEPIIVYQESLDNHVVDEGGETTPALIPNGKIPWDCLNETRKQVVQKYMYEQKDFLTIAKELSLNNGARVKYEFYAALTTLSEYAVIRKFIEDKKEDLTLNQLSILHSIYTNNKTMVECAATNKISKQSVHQTLTRVLKKYNIKWTVFVRKQGNKVIYNIPSVLK